MDNFGKHLGKFLDHLIEQISDGDKKENHDDWIQVGKLTKEDMGLKRSHEARGDVFQQEFELHKSRIQAIIAESEAVGREWWLHLKKTYAFPKGANLTIKGDGRVLMEPKKKKDEA